MMGHLFGFALYALTLILVAVAVRDARRDPAPAWCDPEAYPCGSCPACTP